MKKKKRIKTVVIVLVIVALGIAAYLLLRDGIEKEPVVSENVDTQGQYITYNGKKYETNANVKAILFLGVDKEAKAELGQNPGENGQSDSINLLILDTKEKTGEILQISRDCMIDIDIYDINGEKITTERGQITLQYAYGDGEEKSCRLTAEKVSELLFGVQIQDYVSLTLDGIETATDAIGGVTLTVPKDYTEIDPSFKEGATVTLDGAKSEKYVRSRDQESLEGNNERMERQAQFMQALIKELQTVESDQYQSLYQKLDPYMVTNMTAKELEDLKEYEISDEITVLPGTVQLEDGHAQYLVDDAKTKDLVIKWFYKETSL